MRLSKRKGTNDNQITIRRRPGPRQHQQAGQARRVRTIHAERVEARTLPGGAADLRQDLPDQEADSGADRGSRQITGMSACDVCAFRPSCFERRGRCASFITEKQQRKEVRKAIERINKSQKPTAGTEADTGNLQKGSRRGREVHTDDRQTTEATHDAWKVGPIGSEAESKETSCDQPTTQGDGPKA